MTLQRKAEKKKLGEMMQDAPKVDYESFGKSISADFKSSKIAEREAEGANLKIL